MKPLHTLNPFIQLVLTPNYGKMIQRYNTRTKMIQCMKSN